MPLTRLQTRSPDGAVSVALRNAWCSLF